MPVQNSNESVADILFRNKILNPQVYERVKLENLNTGKNVEDIIKEHNFASSKDIAQAKAEIFKIPYVDLKETSVSPEALNLVPEEVAKRYLCFPIKIDKEKNELSLVMKDPGDLNVIEFIELKTKKKIAPMIAPEEDIIQAIKRYYAQSLSFEVTKALKETDNGGIKSPVIDINGLGKIIFLH